MRKRAVYPAARSYCAPDSSVEKKMSGKVTEFPKALAALTMLFMVCLGVYRGDRGYLSWILFSWVFATRVFFPMEQALFASRDTPIMN